LGGSTGSTGKTIRNVFLIFLVSGLWHGANWTFLVWGLLNALYFLPLLLRRRNRVHLGIVAEGRSIPTLREALAMLGTFGLTVFAWIFFRAESLQHAMVYLGKIFSASLLDQPLYTDRMGSLVTALLVLVFLLIEWMGREQPYAIAIVGKKWPWMVRWSFYALLVFTTGMYMRYSGTPFIYFQF
jgi:D-alanyl-lipoteichoic acid acyltransferase DltB (MBOAT superfamily)